MLTKQKFVVLGPKKGEIRAVAGFKAVDLVTDSILILGCHYSDRKEFVIEKNFNAIIKNMQTVLSLWSSRGLTVGGKSLVFKTLGFSKMQYTVQMTFVPKQIIAQLKLVHKKILWKNDIPRIKHSTLIAYYSDGGFEDIDIPGVPPKNARRLILC